jgi:hypothetical protein
MNNINKDIFDSGASLLDNNHRGNILALHVLLSDSGASLLDNNHLRNILALHVLLSVAALF